MRIVRIDSDKEFNQEVGLLRVEIGDKTYTITENFGKLNIVSHDGSIAVYPRVANVVAIK